VSSYAPLIGPSFPDDQRLIVYVQPCIVIAACREVVLGQLRKPENKRPRSLYRLAQGHEVVLLPRGRFRVSRLTLTERLIL
jgi:hypothetical protein